MLKRRYEFKAEFFDTDPMGIMWHGNYVKYLEMARCKLLDEIGYNYIKMQDNGFTLPIVKMDLKYINPIYFNEYFIVEISVIECDITLKFKYTLLSKDELTIAKANTTQVAVTLNKETLYSIPDDLKFALNQ
ncbi:MULTISPECIES: acyl-CoA thioesterase [Campylobacter]|uniref:acyl-CoA thioesterase n=1 Tax=Campylobacter TaxID=194 RepID=UPI000A337673|nr:MULTISPECIES: acyl-CoA thioesterase [Campylobacter]MBP3675072.1 acyl-CoA thioesterase [Campylobacter sp.]MBR2159171.1 acyl-CoA thioesterase [Campylobacter sp.]MBR2164841.1 acyl-CoA thioesterase [Campylobacter sp.]MBR2222164.1 acyl-CoA thioesterase [Campylobacter sp.]MBR6611543.1 acyl-CoA thioesterase [Campylobacter sp.]